MPSSVIRRDLIFLALAASMVTLYVLFAGGWGFPLDDSWIHQTYGRNLATLGEWAFLPGEPSAASTSPLYTVILAVGYLLQVPYMLWAHLVGTLALAGTAMIGARLAAIALPDSKQADWWVGLGLIGTWHLIWAAASGMETMLFGFLTLLLIYIAWRELSTDRIQTPSALLMRGGVLGIVTALTALARPEGVLLGGIAAVLMLIVRPQGNLQRVVMYGVGAAIGFALVLSPYLWLNWQLTGGVLPNTANAKFEQHAILLEEFSYLERYGRLALAIFVGGQFLLIPGIVGYVWYTQRKQERLRGLYLLLPLLWALAHIGVYAARLPAWYQHGRYVIPTLPALVLIGIIGTLFIVRSNTQSKARRLNTRLRRIGTQAFALSIIGVMAAFILVGMQAYRTDVGVINTEMVAAADYIRENIPEDELMAIHDIGAVGYFASRPMIDIAGLVTPEIIPIVADADALWEYMEANGAQYLMAFPDQIPGDDPTDPRLCRVFITNSPFTAQIRGDAENSMAIYRLAYDATCDA